jgi:hypothetical protein
VFGRRDDVGRVALGDQVFECRQVGRVAVVDPADEAAHPLGRLGHQAGELLVVDQGDRLFAAHDIGELRAGERGVQVDDVGAELRARDRRLDEAAVVAAHDRDAVALEDSVVAQRVGERVRALVDLAECERPRLVDDRLAVGVAQRCDRVAGGGGRAEVLADRQHLDELVRPQRRNDPARDHDARHEEFLGEPVRKLHLNAGA